MCAQNYWTSTFRNRLEVKRIILDYHTGRLIQKFKDLALKLVLSGFLHQLLRS